MASRCCWLDCSMWGPPRTEQRGEREHHCAERVKRQPVLHPWQEWHTSGSGSSRKAGAQACAVGGRGTCAAPHLRRRRRQTAVTAAGARAGPAALMGCLSTLRVSARRWGRAPPATASLPNARQLWTLAAITQSVLQPRAAARPAGGSLLCSQLPLACTLAACSQLLAARSCAAREADQTTVRYGRPGALAAAAAAAAAAGGAVEWWLRTRNHVATYICRT